MNWYKIAKTTHKLYKTAYYNVPITVYQPIINYIQNAGRTIAQNDIKRITQKNFPPITFQLDFSNTQFEFLNTLNPKITINLTKTEGYSVFNKITSTSGEILLSISNEKTLLNQLYYIIEHEVSHFVQELIRTSIVNKYNIDPRDKEKYNNLMGGMPPKDAINPDATMNGYKKDNGKKRIDHTMRPIEHYPDINTSIRILQAINYMTKDKLTKKEIFNAFINDYLTELLKTNGFQNVLDRIQLPVAEAIIKSIKNNKSNNEELYKLYIKQVWVGLHDKPNANFQNIEEYSNELKDIENKTTQTNESEVVIKGIKGGGKSWRLDELVEVPEEPTDIYDSDFEELGIMKSDQWKMGGWSGRKENISSFVIDDLYGLPYIKEKETRDWESYFSIPTKFKQVVKLLKAIKARSNQQKEKQFSEEFDNFALGYVTELAKHLRRKTGKTFNPNEFYQKFYHD